VRALAVDEAGDLIVGGDFTTAGAGDARCVARWDGSMWNALGNGVSGADWGKPCVTAIGIAANGDVIVGGAFTDAGGISAARIARWDGSAWHPLGSGMIGAPGEARVAALAFDTAGNLYAGGWFFNAGPASAWSLARWNRTDWSSLGGGLKGMESWTFGILAYPRVSALAYADGALFVDGWFYSAGDKPANHIAQWTAPVGEEITGPGVYTFYHNRLPVRVAVTTLGDLARINMQRFDAQHPNAPADFGTAYHWQIKALNSSGAPATGYSVNLTLSTAFQPNVGDQICRYTGAAWDCAADSFTSNAITRNGITELSDWAVGNRNGNPFDFRRYLPLIVR